MGFNVRCVIYVLLTKNITGSVGYSIYSTRALDSGNWDRIFVKFASLGVYRLLGRTPSSDQIQISI